ncbi:MAG: lysylphosphatidylglycerol synthase transmembrane domain-containing protein [Pseudomonadota bacterium]
MPPSSASASAQGRFERLVPHLIVSIVAAVVVYAATVIAVDVQSIGTSLGALGLPGWASVLGLSLLNYGLRFLRWAIYLEQLGTRLAPLRSAAYYCCAFTFTTTPGKAGEAIRSLYLKRHGMSYVNSLAAFFVERFVDLVAMVLLSLAAALSFSQYRLPVAVIALLIFLVLPLLHANFFRAFLERVITSLPAARLRSLGSRVLELLGSASTLLRSGPLYAGLALAILAWGAEGVAFHMILGALQIDTSLWLAVGIYAISVLIGALSFIPGGLGTTEAVMVVLLKLLGADTATAVAATLICRLATLWFAVLLGALVFLGLRIESGSFRPAPYDMAGE